LFFYCLPYFNIGLFIFKGVNIMSSKYFYMEELKELISTERRRLEGDGEKSYPTLNILDFKSLEAWVRLRKIFMNLYDEKLQGIVLAVTIVLAIEMILLVLVGLAYFKILDSSGIDPAKQLIETGFQCVFLMSTFFIFVFYAAKVNGQFKIHSDILRANKQIATSIFKYYPDFIGENPLEPATYIYNQGLQFLKREYGENLTPEIEKKMKKEHNELLQTYDQILEELNHEDPIKILGVPITSTVVKSFATLLISAAASMVMPLVKQVLTPLFKL